MNTRTRSLFLVDSKLTENSIPGSLQLNSEAFKVKFANTKRYMNSAIPYMQNLLNKDEETKTIFKDLVDWSSLYIIVPGICIYIILSLRY